ncbi:hydroxymethylglutaryl-CoA reductase [Oceanicoccus sagamiensis]|uniref:hydroxymethylglutaryl-CoA reductase (NADPH) n=1 Tax=Oceanicoccus sagamiensis TaxID=716816 RepID=A0A1X9NIE9_9GAMM|nr:hydroxymethylglutaryl-CoA reductase [Oceanicoccus sagamiensis]ARN75615.1 hydroxymethylglutaryl-CoA reductase [Oceanicoccus sagamiensis]
MSDKKIPRNKDNDYTETSAQTRRDFIQQKTDAQLTHLSQYSTDVSTLPGNIENFTGMAQVPVGLAGPVLINGEHAQGEFYVPLATTEGTLVASYSRGMRLLTASGGVKTTVLESYMQRAPVFLFASAGEARDFGDWLEQRYEDIKAAAEATTSIGKLHHIDQYGIGPMRYLRFSYTTGDAAGQNMTNKATYAACEWIKQNHPSNAIRYMLSGNIDSDKKYSRLNTLNSRGKRVVAEVTIPSDVLKDVMRVDGKTLFQQRQVSNTGSLIAGNANNGAHAANGLTAMFIACGQDAANVAESHAGTVYCQLLDNGDYYWSITLPSLIVGTYGGGTGLSTQKECLDILGCYGKGKANKFAEIVAATVLAGDISLASSIMAGDFVASHDQYGRNRP